MGDWIPIYSQIKCLVQVLAGDIDGAQRTNANFVRTCPVISQGFSLVQFAVGDPEGARDTFTECVNTMDGVVNSTPVIGHVKGLLHYAAKDKERGDVAMKAASHTTAVAAGGVTGMIIGGPAGAVAGGISAGAAMDGAISVVDSKLHDEERLYGLFETFKKIDSRAMSSGDAVDTVGGFLFDGMTGLKCGQAYQSLDKATRSAPTSKTVTEPVNVKENRNFQNKVIAAASGTAIAYAVPEVLPHTIPQVSGYTKNVDDIGSIEPVNVKENRNFQNKVITAASGTAIAYAVPDGLPDAETNPLLSKKVDDIGNVEVLPHTIPQVSGYTKKVDDIGSIDHRRSNGNNQRRSSTKRSSKINENTDTRVPLQVPCAVKVKRIGDLKLGMHIKWKRPLGYTHHALVTDINHEKNQIEVVHYTSSNSQRESDSCNMGRIKKEWLDFESKKLYLLKYRCRLSPEKAIENAQRALKLSRKKFLKKYSLLKNNCEHLITYFVTGNHHSFQAETVKDIMKASVACGLSIALASKRNTTEPVTKSDSQNETSSDADSDEDSVENSV